MGKELDRGFMLTVLALLGVVAYPRFTPNAPAEKPSTTAASAASSKLGAAQISDAASSNAGERQPLDAETRLLRTLAREVLVDVDPSWRGPPGVQEPPTTCATGSCLEKLLCELPERFGGDPPKDGSACAKASDWLAADLAKAIRREGSSREGSKRELSVLVVGVPDPRQSHMALYFDQALVALRDALGKTDFLLDRFVLPWQEPRQGEKSADESKSGVGLLLFRKQRDLKIVFLVAESPVAGVSVEQALAALSLATKLEPPHQPLNVVGPFFSGGMASWCDAFQELPPQTEIQLVSGTATAPRAKLAREVERPSSNKSTAGSPHAKVLECALPSDVTFSRTVPADEELDQFFRERVRAINSRAVMIATLNESGSGYGALSTDANSGDQFRFPLHISEVRAEHERTASTEEPATPRRILGLKLDPREENEPDTPASFSSLTPYDEELALGQELSRICRDGTKYLRIAATDPIDVAFLAQEARKFCPDLTLATFGWDMIFSHPDLASALSGTLIVTSNPPLFAFRNLSPKTATSPFPSSVAEGFYDAVVCAAASTTPCLREPMIWLTELRAGTLWPLASENIGPSEIAPLRGDAPVVGRMPRPQPVTRVVALLLVALGVAHAFWRVAKGERRRASLARLFAPVPPHYRAPQYCAQAVADLSLGLMVGAILPVTYCHFHSPSNDRLWWQGCGLLCLVGGGAVLALFALGSATLVGCLREYQARRPFIGARGVGLIPISLVVIVPLEVAWLCRSIGSVQPDFSLFLLRASDPFGMSPLLPIEVCLAGIYAWALFALHRVKTLARFSVRLPVTPISTVFDRFHDASYELRGVAHDRRWYAPHPLNALALALVVVTAFYAQLHLRSTFEAAPYDYLFKVLFLTLYALVAFGLTRFLLLSQVLRELLQALSAEPMMDAYARIATKVTGSFGLQLRARVAPVEEYQIAVNTCDGLAALATKMANAASTTSGSNPVEAQIGTVAPTLSADHARLAQRFRAAVQAPDSAEAQARAHSAMLQAASHVHGALVVAWRGRARTVAPAAILKSVEAKTLVQGGERSNVSTPALFSLGLSDDAFVWLRAAEDFVAMRVTTFIYQVLDSLRRTLTYCLLASLLLVMAVNAYPFQPARTLNAFGWALVVTVVLAGLSRILRIERNELLSRLAGSEPEHLNFNFNFVTQLFLYVVVPLGFAVAGLFPEVGDGLFSVLGPVRRILGQ